MLLATISALLYFIMMYYERVFRSKKLLFSLFFPIIITSTLTLLDLGNFILDDAYIGFKSARNLASEGILFSYSNLDKPTNVWTSTLLYMIATLILFLLSLFKLDTISAYTFCLLSINMFATIQSCYSTKNIIEYFITISDKNNRRVHSSNSQNKNPRSMFSH
jgi:hypothetical protein